MGPRRPEKPVICENGTLQNASTRSLRSSGLWLRSEATLVDGLHEDGVRETARAVARREATINTHLVLRPGDAAA